MSETEHSPQIVVQPAQGVLSVATDTIGALRGSPMLLVLILLNIGFLGAASYYFTNQQRATERLIGLLLTRCMPDVHGDAYIAPPGGIPQMLTPKGLEDLAKPLPSAPIWPDYEPKPGKD